MSGVSRIGHARWTGAIATGSGTVTAESGAFTDLVYTFPSRTAERSTSTDPEELLATAHAGCFAMSLASVLTQRQKVPTAVSVSAEVTIAPTPAGRRITSSAVTVEGEFPETEDSAWFAEAVESADQRCPFSALIREAGTVTVSAALR